MVKKNKNDEEKEFLSNYDANVYEHPSVAADMVVFSVNSEKEENYRKLAPKQLKILLVRRKEQPFFDSWALPGGFARSGETLEQTAQRKLYEETGISNNYLEQLYTFSGIGRDPRTWVISCTYMALVNEKVLQNKDDACWFTVDWQLLSENKSSTEHSCSVTQQYKLLLTAGDIFLHSVVEYESLYDEKGSRSNFKVIQDGGIAFDHAQIIAVAIKRLQGKLEYTTIALNLMPTLFTLTELQQVYEIILGKPLLKAAFRRKVADLVCETTHYAGAAGHRPSKLYRRNLDIAVN